MSRFPKITETFVLYEMQAAEAAGARVELFPLRRHKKGPRHPEAEAFERRAHFAPFLSWSVLRANVRWLIRDPGAYVRLWYEALSGTLGSLNFFAGALAFLPKAALFAERMQALGVDHVHAHFASHPALVALAVHRLTGIPYSFTAHGSDLHVERRMLPAKVGAASFVVAISAYNRELIVEECGELARSKIQVIHCGADPSVFSSEAPATSIEAPIEDGPLRIVCVASFEEVKGHRFLLDACRQLNERQLPITCDLIGDGPLRADVERAVAQHGLGDVVRIHGALPRPEVQRIVRASDVAALASCPTRSGRREGIPVALMEAMSCGLPVVASGVSGIPELVEPERTGLLVPPGDPWALADALERLAKDPPLRRRLGATARQKVLNDFDLEEGARMLLAEISRRLPPSRGRDT
jgi:glycosyltransferase involved in cell wall biosynthesis